tara:strand:- start:492 stop:692 length:201 start_codon:yes stop_codon:yes gene_type:complete
MKYNDNNKYRPATHGKRIAKDIVIYTDKETASCSGEHDDHPKVYIKVPGICGYCDIRFEKNGRRER